MFSRHAAGVGRGGLLAGNPSKSRGSHQLERIELCLIGCQLRKAIIAQ